MRSKKEEILSKITADIEELRAAYDAFLKLPDSIIDTLFPNERTIVIPEFNGKAHDIFANQFKYTLSAKVDDALEGKRGIVFDIIRKHGTAIKKREIVKKFFDNNPRIKNPEDSVTFALTALRAINKIKNYNPSTTGNVKAGYWTLPEWWDGEELRDIYKPVGVSLNGE